MSFKREVLEKLDKIESRITEQVVNLALNTKVLDEHHKRSTQLEERVKPLEQSHLFTSKLLKAAMSTVAIVAACASAYHYIFTK